MCGGKVNHTQKGVARFGWDALWVILKTCNSARGIVQMQTLSLFFKKSLFMIAIINKL